MSTLSGSNSQIQPEINEDVRKIELFLGYNQKKLTYKKIKENYEIEKERNTIKEIELANVKKLKGFLFRENSEEKKEEESSLEFQKITKDYYVFPENLKNLENNFHFVKNYAEFKTVNEDKTLNKIKKMEEEKKENIFDEKRNVELDISNEEVISLKNEIKNLEQILVFQDSEIIREKEKQKELTLKIECNKEKRQAEIQLQKLQIENAELQSRLIIAEANFSSQKNNEKKISCSKYEKDWKIEWNSRNQNEISLTQKGENESTERLVYERIELLEKISWLKEKHPELRNRTDLL